MMNKPGEDDRQLQVPTENRGNDDGRRVNRDAGGKAALHQKKKRAEQSRLLIESLAEIFVGGDDFEPMKNRNENRADDEEREGQPEIILHETHPAFVSLPGRGKKSDGAGLRAMTESAIVPQRIRFVAVQIMAEIVIAPRLPPMP